MKAAWIVPEKIYRVMRATGCPEATAREYLLAEEGSVDDAIVSLLGDVKFAQEDAAYLYRSASAKRDSGDLASGWVAARIQLAAAHSARNARQALGVIE